MRRNHTQNHARQSKGKAGRNKFPNSLKKKRRGVLLGRAERGTHRQEDRKKPRVPSAGPAPTTPNLPAKLKGMSNSEDTKTQKKKRKKKKPPTKSGSGGMDLKEPLKRNLAQGKFSKKGRTKNRGGDLYAP